MNTNLRQTGLSYWLPIIEDIRKTYSDSEVISFNLNSGTYNLTIKVPYNPNLTLCVPQGRIPKDWSGQINNEKPFTFLRFSWRSQLAQEGEN
jgi:hypothetical protein